MDSEFIFRLTFALLVIAILGIRLWGHLKAGTLNTDASAPRQQYDEGLITRVMRPMPILIFVGGVLYLAAPHLMQWAVVDLPLWLRWLSLPLVALNIGGMYWVHSSLSKNFSGQLVIRDDHTLITWGPYRYVRHPMYTAVMALFITIFFLTANWFIGLGGLVIIGTVIVARTPREEAMLIETFGDLYREYMKRTPRYFPRLILQSSQP